MFLNDIKDVQGDITKMNGYISNWDTELETLDFEQIIAHGKFTKRIMEVIKDVEKAALDILKKLKEGQQILKHDISKMKIHVNGLKTEIEYLLENTKNIKNKTAKREISTKGTIMEKGENVIELGRKLQQLKSNVEHVKSDVQVVHLLSKMKHNVGNITENLSKMILVSGFINHLNLSHLEMLYVYLYEFFCFCRDLET